MPSNAWQPTVRRQRRHGHRWLRRRPDGALDRAFGWPVTGRVRLVECRDWRPNRNVRLRGRDVGCRELRRPVRLRRGCRPVDHRHGHRRRRELRHGGRHQHRRRPDRACGRNLRRHRARRWRRVRVPLRPCWPDRLYRDRRDLRARRLPRQRLRGLGRDARHPRQRDGCRRQRGDGHARLRGPRLDARRASTSRST